LSLGAGYGERKARNARTEIASTGTKSALLLFEKIMRVFRNSAARSNDKILSSLRFTYILAIYKANLTFIATSLIALLIFTRRIDGFKGGIFL